jgi:hypothetical protein
MADRRAFLKSAALAPATLVLPAAAIAAEPTPTPTPHPPDAVAQALTDAVRARFGEQLDLASLEEVRKGIAENLAAAARLRALKVGNADGPAALFAARGEVRPR